MTENGPKSPKLAGLLKRAETLLDNTQVTLPDDWSADFWALFEDLQTYRMELETQNEELRQAKEELAASRDRYADLYDFSPAGFVTLTGKGLIRRANLTFAKMLGLSKERLASRLFSDFVYPEDQDQLYRSCKKLLKEKKRQTMELRLQNAVDGPFWARMECIPVTGGRPDSAIDIRVVVSDITERKQAETALAESEARYRELVEHANSAIIHWKPDGTITFSNDYAQDFFGYHREEMVGKNVHTLIPEKDSSGLDLTTLIEDIASNPENYAHYINENICRDGRRVWIAWTNRPIFDKEGALVEILAIGTDITEQKAMEQALKESHDLLEKRVAERTAELVRATLKMEQEIYERKEKEKALRQSEAKLAKQKEELEEINTALQVILKKREFDRQEIEEQVVANIKGLVTPFLEKLKKSGLNSTQKNYVEIIDSNLNDIVASFVHTVSSQFLKLTPSEIQVANLVKQGKSTKEIAALMNLSTCTINVHRRNIRRKLGLSSKKKNLQTFLAAKE